MITILFTDIRLLKLIHLSYWQKCNKKYFVNEIYEGINEECNQGGGCRMTNAMKIHMDNSRAHGTMETVEKMRKKKMEKLAHPFYSLDLSQCDF
jgi:hypothetical protein